MPYSGNEEPHEMQTRRRAIEWLRGRSDEQAASAVATSRLTFEDMQSGNDSMGRCIVAYTATLWTGPDVHNSKALEERIWAALGQILSPDGVLDAASAIGPLLPPPRTDGVSREELRLLVEGYIGVVGGNLDGFSHNTLQEFFLDFGIDLGHYGGTKRERLLSAMERLEPARQAQVIAAVLARLPVASAPQRSQQLHARLSAIASRLAGHVVGMPADIGELNRTLDLALQNAEALMTNGSVVGAVDRIHTALHAYLKELCRQSSVSQEQDDTVSTLLKKLRREHSAFVVTGARRGDVEKILGSLSVIADASLPVRNDASLAHPNDALLDEPEARLVVNAVKAVIVYLRDKAGSQKTTGNPSAS